jgi:hypothetical protein
MLGPRTGPGGSGAIGFILLCAIGWFGLCYLGNLRHRALTTVPSPPTEMRSVPTHFPFTREQPDLEEIRDAWVPVPDPVPEDPDDDPQ